jgi:TP901 family phage tail tape measure protein
MAGFISVLGSGRAFSASIRLASNYEAELQKVVGLVGVAQGEVDAMGESILKMSTALGTSPQELAEGLFFVTSAGARGAKAMEILEASAMAAQAGLGSTATVADAVTSAVNAYASSGMTAAKATGILVAAVREGKASADEMAGSMGQVLGLASAVGVGFDEVAASVAAMTRVGITSAEAVTSLKATLSAIYNPTSQSIEAFEAMGLSVEQLRESLADDGLLATLRLVGEASDGNNAKVLEAIPNIRAMGAVFTLLGENADAVEQIFKSLAEETGGSLQKAFAAASETSKKKFSEAMSALQVTAIDLGTRALPTVTRVIEAMAAILPAVGSAVIMVANGLMDFGKAALAIWGAHKAILAFNVAFAWTKAAASVGFLTAIAMEFALVGKKATVSAAALKSMNVQLALVGAGIAGFQIGKKLREEFTAVEVVGNELFGAVQRGWNNISYVFKAGALGIKYHFQTVIGDMKILFADFIRLVASGLELTGFGWAEESAASLRVFADGMRRGIMTAGEYERQLAALGAERVAENKAVTQFVQDLNDEAEARDRAAAAAKKQNEEASKTKGGTKTTQVSYDLDETALERLGGLFDSMMPDASKRAELESALIFVDDALGRIQQKVASGLPAALNGVPVDRFKELRFAIEEALLEMDPLEQAARSTTEAYYQLFDETRTPLEQLIERKSELRDLEAEMLALYPLQADAIRDTIARALDEADEGYQALLKRQRENTEEMKRMEQGAHDLGMTFSSAFEDALVEGKKFSDILKGLEQDILRIITRMMITQPLADALGGMFGGAFGGVGGNALGGPVGRASWVGEHGKELVVQGQEAGARVLSHSDSMRIAREAMTGGAGKTVVNVGAPRVHVPATKVEVHQYGGGEPAQVETQQQPDGSQLIKVLVNTFNQDLAQNGPMSRAIKSKYGLSSNLAMR